MPTPPPALGPVPESGEGAPPADRDALLARVSSERRRIYELVRQVLDELDEAAPWGLLYYPPDARETFLDLVRALLAVVDGIPESLQGLIASMTEGADEETRQALEDAEFFFYGIHNMVAGDLERLRGRLEGAVEGPDEALSVSDRNLLSALSADLKGKYASALMGATASIVAEGVWTGVAAEPVLFPEKAEEFRRNEKLVASLQDVLASTRRLPEEIDFAGLLERWRQGSRADQYALTELSAFRATLGRLLKSDNRRALYSGDYQEIQHREALLSEGLGELEMLHRRLWDQILPASKAAGTYARLCQLTLKFAAVLDVHLLEELVGASAVRQLRVAITADRQGAVDAPEPSDPSRWRALAPDLRPLAPLLAEEDLRTYLELLLGAVRKRASFSLPVSGEPTAGATKAGQPVVPDLEDLGRELAIAPAPSPPPRPPSPSPAPAPSQGTATQTRAGAGVPVVSPEQRLEAVEELRRILEVLQAPGSSQWSALRMLQRLMAKHSRVPPTMVQSSHPFLFEILNTLVPQLEIVASFGGVPADTRQKLVANCLELSRPNLSPEQMQTQVPLALNRLVRLVEALTAVSGGMARSLRQELEKG